MSLFAELKRRSVFKVGAAYLVVAWLVVQVASIAFPAFEAPAWVLRIFILVALLGFPIALVLAWVFETTPDGMQRDTSALGSKRLFSIAAVLAVLVIGWYVRDQPAFQSKATTAATPAQSVVANVATPARAEHAIPQKSIAVLPFTDLSPMRDQEYFSDGMAEEILNALAKVKDLKVAGRTSSFAFKGRNEDLRIVGRELAVAHVLEGSVRMQGERVRITAQLIKADDGYHLWSETYDGDLADVFELQERIARAITEQLKVVLQGPQQQRLVPVATTVPEAYALYLKASDIFNRRDGKRWPEAIAALEQALALDPRYSRAHARLATVFALGRLYVADFPSAVERMQSHARQAIALDATLGEPHAALAQSFARDRDFIAARAEFEAGLALEPDDVTLSFWYAIQLVQTGYTKQGRAELDRVLTLDARLPNALYWRGSEYFFDGDPANAARMWRHAAEAKLAFTGIGLSRISASEGRTDEAITQLAAGYRAIQLDMSEADGRVLARGTYGSEADRRTAVALGKRYLASAPQPVSGVWIQALFALGEPKFLLATAEHPTSNDAAFLGLLWNDAGEAARRLPEFPDYVRRIGLTALWDRYGAPDHCRKTEAGAWACQ